MYTITLHDGTKLNNLELNGDNFIADGVVEDSVFQDNLATVTISDGENTNSYEDMVLLGNRVEDGRSWFVLAVKTDQQKRDEAMNRKMTDMENALYVLLTGKEV